MNKTHITVALILGASLLVYGYMQIQQKNQILIMEQKRADDERAHERLLEIQRDECIANAHASYSQRWDADLSCYWVEGECRLSSDRAGAYDKQLQDDKDRCIEMYR